MRKGYPRIAATPEQIAQRVLGTGRPKARDYRCAACGRAVAYPDTLHDDGRCAKCHTAAV